MRARPPHLVDEGTACQGMTTTRCLQAVRAPTPRGGLVTAFPIDDAGDLRQEAVHSLGKPFQLPERLGCV
jgi:hypothetical protein